MTNSYNKIPLLIPLLLMASACAQFAGQEERFTPSRPVGVIVADTMTGTAEGAWEAVQAPLEDLRLKERPIPEKLQIIARNPYQLPATPTCGLLQQEVFELDILLGPDVCTPDNPTGSVSHKGEYIEQGSKYAKDQAVGMVGDKVNIIPLRGVVRKLTGAEKHSKEVEAAYQAGKLRRAFLKGIMSSAGVNCPLPLPFPSR